MSVDELFNLPALQAAAAELIQAQAALAQLLVECAPGRGVTIAQAQDWRDRAEVAEGMARAASQYLSKSVQALDRGAIQLRGELSA